MSKEMRKKMRKQLQKTVCALGAALVVLTGVFGLSAAAEDGTRLSVLYNGTEIAFTHTPFTEGGEVYLPLRETLLACGIANEAITYQNRIVRVALPSPVYADPVMADLQIDNTYVTFDLDKAADYNVYQRDAGISRSVAHPILLRGDTAYAPLGAFVRFKHFDIPAADANGNRTSQNLQLLQGLEVRQYSSDGTFDVLLERTLSYQTDIPLSPEAFYQDGERVLIGDAAQQDTYGYNPPDESGVRHPVKRILTTASGEVAAVIPIENQTHEAMNVSGYRPLMGIYNWDDLPRDSLSGVRDENNNAIDTDILICDPATNSIGTTSQPIFYIPPELCFLDRTLSSNV